MSTMTIMNVYLTLKTVATFSGVMLLSKDKQNLLKIIHYNFLVVGMQVKDSLSNFDEEIWDMEFKKRLERYSKKAIAPIILMGYCRDISRLGPIKRGPQKDKIIDDCKSKIKKINVNNRVVPLSTLFWQFPVFWRVLATLSLGSPSDRWWTVIVCVYMYAHAVTQQNTKFPYKWKNYKVFMVFRSWILLDETLNWIYSYCSQNHFAIFLLIQSLRGLALQIVEILLFFGNVQYTQNWEEHLHVR